jgi:HlyD family secretion protein
MSLFRKSALDALSNPEKLDQPLKLLRPGQWLLLLSLGSFCLSAAAWIILGKLPVRISGQGLLVRQNSLLLIQAETTGRLKTLEASAGDCIAKGDVLAQIEPVREEIEKDQAKVQLRQLRQHDQKEDQLGAARIDQQRQSIARIEGLAAIGAIPLDDLERRQQQLIDVEDSIASRNSQREQQITQQQTRIQTLNKTMRRIATIKAPTSGCIVDSSVHLDDVVTAGKTLLTLEVDSVDAKLESLVFFAAKDGKRLAVGQQVRISPASTKPQRHGGIKGMVTAVQPLPVRKDALRKRLGLESLVAAVQGEQRGPIIEVSTSLQLDPNTVSGFDWGGGPGPDLQLTPGTPTSVRVLVEERRPISYVLPILRDLTGIY